MARSRGLRIGTRFFLIVLLMMLLTLASTYVVYSHFEDELLGEVQDQSESLSKALQISVQQLTAQGMTDDSLLKEYVQRLSSSGVKEISILSNEKTVVASSNAARVGQKVGGRAAAGRPAPRRAAAGGRGAAAAGGDGGLVITGTLPEEDAGDTEGTKTTTLDIPIIVDNQKRGYVRLHLLFDDLNEMMWKASLRRLLATAAVFLAGMAGVIALSFGLTRSLNEMASAAARVAQGDLSVRVVSRRRDETGRLVDTFNNMVSRLRDEKALEARLRRAERTSAIGRLASAVAHEIRNPLNLISLSVGHLGTAFRPEQPERAEEFRRTVDAVREELHRLNRMVTDFLNYGRPPRLAPRPCRLDDLLHEVASLTEAKANAQKVEIICRDAPDLPEVVADPEGIRTCFLNIAMNAVQAMPDGGRLVVETERSRLPDGAPAVTVTFRDTGCGIAPGDLEKVVEPYFSTRDAGVGLGLAITQRIVEEHGGRIRIESAPGRGTTFRIDLPVAGPDAASAADVVRAPAASITQDVASAQDVGSAQDAAGAQDVMPAPPWSSSGKEVA